MSWGRVEESSRFLGMVSLLRKNNSLLKQCSFDDDEYILWIYSDENKRETMCESLEMRSRLCDSAQVCRNRPLLV